MFDKRWVQKPEVKNIISLSWGSSRDGNSGSLLDKIADCHRALFKWKRGADCNSKMRLTRLKEQIDLEGSKRRPNKQRLKDLKWELAQAYRDEEIYWKERSKESWLRHGDRNTKYFHGSVQKKRARNNISALVNSNGAEQISEGSKGEIAVDYFRKLFTSSKPVHATELLTDMVPRVTENMNRELTKPVSRDEIRKAAFGIQSNKTPGADGMTGQFFESYWDNVGEQVIREVNGFFESGQLPHEWNFAQICLLPKKINPTRMTYLNP
ncbi:hypothetical protein V5N11_020916 [Cardamine amara subsp. amara]|uniref:Reverse transcriptase n=1 Tax=Cardamine amara subsp. amara TaxID=228776 RepID=A0ABD0Z8Y0_CARAN